jgi:hypothetical protein
MPNKKKISKCLPLKGIAHPSRQVVLGLVDRSVEAGQQVDVKLLLNALSTVLIEMRGSDASQP